MLVACSGCPHEELPQSGIPGRCETGGALLGGKNPLSIGIGWNHLARNPAPPAPTNSTLDGAQPVGASATTANGPGRVDSASVAIASRR